MTEQAAIFETLRAPFDPEVVSWRVGSTNADKTKGMALAYIDARDVMGRLDEAVGPLGWQCEYVAMANGTTCCRIAIWTQDRGWVWKANGAGATDFEAEKGAYSDAFKRAAVLWGVGQYLYDLPAPWVAVEAKGRTVLIKKEEMAGLKELLRGKKPKSAYQARRDGTYPFLESAMRLCTSTDELQEFWRDHQKAIKELPPGWRTHLEEEKDRLKKQFQAENEGASV